MTRWNPIRAATHVGTTVHKDENWAFTDYFAAGLIAGGIGLALTGYTLLGPAISVVGGVYLATRERPLAIAP